jgi:predicted RNA methylase
MRDYTKFFTYPETAEFMAKLLDPKEYDYILEPSAGNGALVKAVKKIQPKCYVDAIEIDRKWQDELKNCADSVHIEDFTMTPRTFFYDKCIANPPFGNETNLEDHFDNIIDHVKRGGKIVMLVPESFNPKLKFSTYPLENWSKNKDGTTTPIKIIEFKNPY